MKKNSKHVLLVTTLFITACGPSAGRLQMEAMEAEHERIMAEIEDEKFENEMQGKAITLAHASGISVPFMLTINDLARRCNNKESCVAKFYVACKQRAGGDQTTEQQNAMAKCMTSAR
jgi:hypothetical protein